MKKLLLVLLSCTLAIFSATAATFTVTSLSDSGAGSLRAAITSANAASGSSLIDFSISGTISLSSALPTILKPMTIDGTTAPGYVAAPVVEVSCNGWPGIAVGTGADGTVVKALSVTGSGNAGLTITASNVTVAGNYLGLTPAGTVDGNFGDGLKIMNPSAGNLIGSTNILTGITYYDTTDALNFTLQPVTGWQGIRNYASSTTDYLICGTVNTSGGLLYVGPVAGGGTSYNVTYPGADTIATSVYGPSNLSNGDICLVGTYRTNDSPSTIFNYGFVWQGALTDLPSGGTYHQILYPNAKYNFVHSTMGNLAVGNCDGPKTIDGKTVPVGAGQAFIYNLDTNTFIANIVFPGSKSNSAYGIWQNSNTSYTIVGGYTLIVANSFPDDNRPLAQGKGYMVDYDSSTNKFTNWTSFSYPNGAVGVNFITHFEGISSAQPGVYTLAADSVQANSQNPSQGSWVNVSRNTDGTFTSGTWEDLNFTQNGVPAAGVTSADSVYGDNVVGIVIGSPLIAYQAVISTGFQLSNVISGNRGNGVNIFRSKNNTIAMNYIGTDPAGDTTTGFGNGANGIYLTSTSMRNMIGGQFVDYNNPTGDKNPANAVFQTPPQGNLISGNAGNGVLIDGASIYNTLSGNFIGTDYTGKAALPNGAEGVVFDGANWNSLIGCTFYQNPFVYYNVICGNVGNGVRITDSSRATVQANFIGIGADNATTVANGGDGLLVNGNGANIQVGGVIPLGNVISGNTRNGIEVADRVSGFTSFNTFGGLAAFQTFPSPNGGDGTLITSTGGNNLVRTCILSGNLGNGLEIAGNASDVQVADVSLGTLTDINGPLPNQGSGIVIGGTAHKISIGGFEPSVEPTVFASGNMKYGIFVTGAAYSNTIVHANVGLDVNGPLGNGQGGIFLDRGTRATTIGGKGDPLKVNMQANTGAGLYIYYSTQNKITNAVILNNTVAGLYGFGACTSTTVVGSTILSNGPGGTNNVDISRATGITVRP